MAAMTARILIPGKNWRLSLAETVAVLEARNVQLKVQTASKAFFVVNTETENNGPFRITDFGGILKIGEVSRCFPTSLLREMFLQKNKEAKQRVENEIKASRSMAEMLGKALGKYLFGVSVYCADNGLQPHIREMQRFVGSTIKRELATHGVKSSFMGFSKTRQPQLTHVEVLKKNMVENKAELLFSMDRDSTWAATTIGVHDPFEFQKRDIAKPYQRKIFAMPPRLAKIMVNLSSCTPGKTLLDPFCGVGTILLEAALSGAELIGMDLNPWCVKAAEENLKWLKQEYGLKQLAYEVLEGDARRLSEKLTNGVDCIATEPDLGPALRHVPTTAYALKVIERLKPLYHSFLEETFKVLKKNGRLVIVTPFLKTRSEKPVTMPIDEKAEDVGFKKLYVIRKELFSEAMQFRQEALSHMGSFVDVEERHKIGREIHIFQKQR